MPNAPQSHGPYAKPVTVPKEGESAVYRNANCLDGVFMPKDVTTLYENFQRGLKISPKANCLGKRKISSDGKAGPYEWQSFTQVDERVTAFGSGLLQLQQQIPSIAQSAASHQLPVHKLDTQWHVGIYSINRPEWLITDLACSSYSLISVALYDTLGADILKFTINHAELGVVVCSGDKVPSLLKVASQCPSLKVIVSMDQFKSGDKSTKILQEWAKEKGIQLFDFQQVEDLGRQSVKPHRPPQAEDICTICYTSGTTGNPKGALLMHKNFVSAAHSIGQHGITLESQDVHISYLPLAHCFERVLVTSILGCGASIGFYRGDVLLLVEDVQELKPTFFPSVPRLFNRIYDKLTEGTVKAGGLKGWLFRKAVASKVAILQDSKIESKQSVYDWTLFAKVRQVLGGRVRLMITGSAPIGGDVLTFLRAVFCCEILEGFGQTECAAGSTLTFPGDYTTGQVGAPIICNEYKLVDVPEMGYTSRDPEPRGEICIRGHNVMKGYYKDVEKTRETITEDGWLLTGDIGKISPSGTMAIIDRKKNIFKLAQGEYVAAEKLEVVFGTGSPFIAQIFVHGDSLQSELVAIVVPDQERIVNWATKKSLLTTQAAKDASALVKLPQVKDLLLKELAGIARKGKLAGFELPKNIHVEYELFSVENDLLTPSFKLKRNVAAKKYRQIIDSLYEELAQQKQQGGAKGKALL
ncbi:hypothetical protein MIR68_009910 [Amoeboaphelidium protococcarum]|nr:hypothetical protein MIR68_009910 [Amoeboaphelidium protococcarum]